MGCRGSSGGLYNLSFCLIEIRGVWGDPGIPAVRKFLPDQYFFVYFSDRRSFNWVYLCQSIRFKSNYCLLFSGSHKIGYWGVLYLRNLGLVGAIILIIAHGLSSSVMFFGGNVLYTRRLTRRVLLRKGILSFFPLLSFF